MRRMTFDRERVAEFVRERAAVESGGWYEAFGVEDENGNILGGVLFNEFNGSNICAHIASTDKRWVTKDMLRVMCCYPFFQLGVRRVTGYVRSSNLDAQRFDEHIGFRKEAVLREAAPNGEDLIIYVMFKDECRFLRNYHDPNQDQKAA